MKQVVSLMCKNYFHQLNPQKEDAQYPILVHSDVHLGNFMVAEQNEVAILDRDFFIELDEQDAAFFMKLVENPHNPFGLFGAVMEYLKNADPKNREVLGSLNSMTFFGELMSIFSENIDYSQKFMKVLVMLRKQGIKIPLKCSLIIKNIQGLNQMAQKAGFEHVYDAYNYSMAE